MGKRDLSSHTAASSSRPRIPVAIRLALLLAVCGCTKKDAPKKPTPEAGYIVVQRQSVEIPTLLSGRTSAFESSEVRPQVSGLIRARMFTEGSLVRAGQTLYQIDRASIRRRRRRHRPI